MLKTRIYFSFPATNVKRLSNSFQPDRKTKKSTIPLIDSGCWQRALEPENREIVLRIHFFRGLNYCRQPRLMTLYKVWRYRFFPFSFSPRSDIVFDFFWVHSDLHTLSSLLLRGNNNDPRLAIKLVLCSQQYPCVPMNIHRQVIYLLDFFAFPRPGML